MVIYLDLIFLINLIFDGSLLLTVDLLLKRNTKYFRILVGSIIGELSMITLFVNMGNVGNDLFKILLNLLMCLGAFSFKDVRYTFYNFIFII